MAKSPKPPDPYKTASAQQGAEVGAAGAQSIIGNPNVYSPYGSQTYSIAGWEQVPGANGQMIRVPRYNMTQSLSPDQQRLMGLQTQQQYNMGLTGVEQSAKLRGLLGQNVDTSGWNAWNAGPQAANLNTNFRRDEGPTDRAAIEKAMMANYTQDTSGQHAAQDAQMAARGLMPGSAQYGGQYQQREQARGRAGREAYLASGQESRQAQDAYNQAMGLGNAAQQQMFEMQGSSADRANALRQAQAQEAFALRNQPLNEISALLAGSQVTMPQFNPYQSQGINAPNIMGAVQQNYQQQAQAANAFNSGLFQLGGAAVGGMFGGSDRRLKQDIEPIEGMRLAGAPLYHFRYTANPEELQIGVMADEVRPLHPDAVVEIDGYDHVNYSLLLSRHEGDQDHG